MSERKKGALDRFTQTPEEKRMLKSAFEKAQRSIQRSLHRVHVHACLEMPLNYWCACPICYTKRLDAFERDALYTFEVMSRGRVVRLESDGFIPDIGHRHGCMDGRRRDHSGLLCDCGMWERFNQWRRAER